MLLTRFEPLVKEPVTISRKLVDGTEMTNPRASIL